MADIPEKKIVDTLFAYNELLKEKNELLNRSLDELQKEEKIQKKIADTVKKLKLPYDSVARSISHSLNDMKLFEFTQARLSHASTTRAALEEKFTDKIREFHEKEEIWSAKKKKSIDELKLMQQNFLALQERIGLRDAHGIEISQARVNAAREEVNEFKKKRNEIFKQHREYLSSQEKEQNKYKEAILNQNKIVNSLRLKNQLGQGFNSILNQTGMLGNVIQKKSLNWVDVILHGVDAFFKYDTAAFTLRKNLGLIRKDFDVLEKNVNSLGREMQHLGISFDQVAAATNAIAGEFNSLVATDKELVKDISILTAQLGLAESDSARFLKTMSSVSQTTHYGQKGMTGFAKSMANAAGIPLHMIMKDVADAADDVRIFTGKSALNLVKMSVEARQMGTSMQNMAMSAKKLLDFQTSIVDEMEASVLLGRDLNFEQARNLAYRKDIVGANKEILRIAKQINFDGMDPYQAEAFARASGKSLQELQEMIQADKEIQHIRNSGNSELIAQLDKLEQMKRMRSEEAMDIGKMAEKRLREEANQERILVLQNQFNQLMMDLAGPVMDVVEPLMSIATKIFPPILKGITLMTPIFGLFKLFSYFDKIKWIGPMFEKIGTGIASIGTKLASIGGGIGKIFGFAGKFIGVFSKFLGPIGLVINAFQFVNSLLKHWEETPKGFLGGLEAIKNALHDVFLKPFKDAWDWISDKFVGKSPSKLGLGIFKGIQSIGGMLIDALISPFRTSFNLISGLFGGPKMPKISDVLAAEPSEIKTSTANSSTELSSVIAEGNKQIVAKLNELIAKMESGAISVNIDGSKASALLMKAQKERGTFGSI